MDPDFWHARWHNNQIGFHLNQVNPYLVRYWSELDPQPESVVLVPLCGKSLDLVWLASQGYHVVGVEISPIAVESFFIEQKIDTVQQGEYRGFKVYSAEGLSLLNGDFFNLDSEFTEDVSLIYDRASMVALPESMRDQYAEKILELTRPGMRILLVTFEYDQEKMDGPPFSVHEAEVYRHYEQHFAIKKLASENILAESPRFAARGLDKLVESVFLLERR